MVPRARLCRLSPRCESRSPAAAGETAPVLFPSRPQAANASPSADSPLVSANRSAVPSPPAGPFLCSAQRKRRKKCARGNLRRRKLRSFRFRGYRKSRENCISLRCSSCSNRSGRFGLKRTICRNLRVFALARIPAIPANKDAGGFPGTPSPTPKGLRPLGTPVGFTGDEGRETRDCLQEQDRTTAYKCLREVGAYRPSSAPVVVARENGRFPAFSRIPAGFSRLQLSESNPLRWASIRYNPPSPRQERVLTAARIAGKRTAPLSSQRVVFC